MGKSTFNKLNIFWFRRDLRLYDNAGLYFALKGGLPVLPLFVFDIEILEKLEDRNDARVMFIHDEISKIHDSLRKFNSGLLVIKGRPLEILNHLVKKYQVDTVFCNHDYEPYAKKRDEKVKRMLRERGVGFKSYKDQVIFEKEEILNNQEEPYKVFTPYKNEWLTNFTDNCTQPFPSEKLLPVMFTPGPETIPSLSDIGFKRSEIAIPPRKLEPDIIQSYHESRDFPSQNGTTRLGIHLRHGTVSIREAVRTGKKYNKIWLNELIWREFYMMILHHFPKVVNHSFKSKYDRIRWDNQEDNFAKWCEGRTGYPIVDAGMRQLNKTGYMHNRVRMIVASFLTKHLLIDWRWGEAYFAGKLLDYELASNNGGWQWAAGTGTDAQPYFRIFNPSSQTTKFDPDLAYIKKWIPEIHTEKYPKPMVEHTFARKRAIETYKNALN